LTELRNNLFHFAYGTGHLITAVGWKSLWNVDADSEKQPHRFIAERLLCRLRLGARFWSGGSGQDRSTAFSAEGHLRSPEHQKDIARLRAN